MSETDNVTENEDVNIAVCEEDIINHHDLQMTSSPAMETDATSRINVEPSTSTIIAHPSDEIPPDTEMEQSATVRCNEMEQPTTVRGTEVEQRDREVKPEAEQPRPEKDVIIDQPITDQNAELELSASLEETEMNIEKRDIKSVTSGETEPTVDAE